MKPTNKETDKKPIEINLVNLGTVNKNKVVINKGLAYVSLYFSYETIIAVKSFAGFKVSVNDWSQTTGKLLNELEPDKSLRVDHSEVLKEAEKQINKIMGGV